MTPANEDFTIREVAEATDLSLHTLRYYERIGLIHPISRADNHHRRYAQEDISWINFLKKLRATGMSIQDMQTYAELQRQGDKTLAERLEMLKTLQADVETRIEELNEHLEVIRYKIGYYGGLIAEMMEGIESQAAPK